MTRAQIALDKRSCIPNINGILSHQLGSEGQRKIRLNFDKRKLLYMVLGLAFCNFQYKLEIEFKPS